jgi:hypothetical protein
MAHDGTGLSGGRGELGRLFGEPSDGYSAARIRTRRVDIFDQSWDPVAERLYDELISRTWPLHRVFNTPSTDVEQSTVAVQLATFATTQARSLRAGSHHACRLVDGLLWPSGSRPRPDDPWWATPRGQGHFCDPPRSRAMPPLAATNTY